MKKDLSRVDLNLLNVLRVLLDERSVSRAAERLFVSQPAISNNLRQLREVFDDPLFTRTSHGLIPTPKSLQLHAELSSTLSRLASIVSNASYDPTRATGSIIISIPDLICGKLIPVFLRELNNYAPAVQLIVEVIQSRYDDDCGKNHFELLRNGLMDFALLYEPLVSPETTITPLATSEFSCCMRLGHPLASHAQIEIEDLVGYPQVAFYVPHLTPERLAVSNRLLEARGLRIEPALMTTSLHLSLEMVCASDVLLVSHYDSSGSSLMDQRVVHRPLAHVLPVSTDRKPELYLVQHHRTFDSPLHRWIAERLQSICQELYPD